MAMATQMQQALCLLEVPTKYLNYLLESVH